MEKIFYLLMIVNNFMSHLIKSLFEAHLQHNVVLERVSFQFAHSSQTHHLRLIREWSKERLIRRRSRKKKPKTKLQAVARSSGHLYCQLAANVACFTWCSQSNKLISDPES